jgi:DNA-directed RNA polymerase subunit E'/Rpb7
MYSKYIITKMDTKTITRWIKINPRYIGVGLSEHVRDEIVKQMSNECDEHTGHVIRVIKVYDIIDNQIQNSSSEMVVLVKFDIEIFKPVSGLKVPSVIKAIYQDGILVESHDIQKILIPASTYRDSYVFEDNMLTHGEKTLSKGDNLGVNITAVRYDDHCFSCLGVIA